MSVHEILGDLRELIEIESPSNDRAALNRSADGIDAMLLRRLGRTAERVSRDGVPHLRIAWGERTQVLLLAHHDTVWPLDTLNELPFSLEDGVIRGPGCFDMKLGLVIAVHALAAVDQRLGGLDGIALLVTGDEEVGSGTSRELIESSATGCRAVFVLEASGDGGALKTERKGVSNYRLEVSGRAAHAGLEPEKGINASVVVASLILQVDALTDSAIGTTVTPTTVGAGSSANTVPAAAWVDVDVRACTRAEQKRVDLQLRGLTTEVAGATVNVTGGPNRPPLERAMTEELFTLAQDAARALGQPPLESVAVGGGSDGNLTAALGVRTLDGLGAVGGGAHSRDEHALVEWIEPRVQLLVELIIRTLGEPQ